MNFAQGIVYNDQARDAVQRLVPVAQSAGLSLPTLALTFFRTGPAPLGGLADACSGYAAACGLGGTEPPRNVTIRRATPIQITESAYPGDPWPRVVCALANRS
jgi:hypothetical protein